VNPAKNYSSRMSGAGSLIPETKIILSELAKGIGMKELERNVFVDNILDKVTLSSRKKTYSAIKLRFLLNPELDRVILIKLINSHLNDSIKDLILYYYLSKAEVIAYDLTTQFLYEQNQNGNLGVSKDDTLAFFESQREKHPEIDTWTPTTRLRIVEHYLAIMKDFKILKGSRKKLFDVPFIPLEVVLFVIYSLLDAGLNAKQILNSHDFKLFFFSKSDIIKYLDEATRKALIKFKYTGEIYELVPCFKDLEGYVNEITRKI